jgi:FkbM family methyltransferase
VTDHTKVIYDLGANKGDNIPYYLKKADRVVAVEANPVLADQIRARFHQSISEGRLIVHDCVLTCDKDSRVVNFYVHKTLDVKSQFPRPDADHMQQFTEVQLPSMDVLGLIDRHGKPFYIKIDIENYDQVILRELFLNDIRPEFISAESHSIQIFSLLLTLGSYVSFNIVDGPTVASKYKDAPIKTAGGEERYSFPEHSAGPFGEDIAGKWMTPDNFFRLLAFEQLGWKDVHATTAIPPDPNRRVYSANYLHKEIIRQAADATRARSPLLYSALRKARRRLSL